MSRTVYFISGLGADERAFQDIKLEGEDIVFISWVKHYPTDSLADYAKRLAGQIKKEGEVVIVGLSLGGILAIELTRIIPVARTIIISSIKSEEELPLLYRFGRNLTFILRTFPYGIIRACPFLLFYYMGVKTEREKKLLKEFIRHTDEDFIHWAVERIVKWRNREMPAGLLHIHGTSDRVFPSSYIRNARFIKGGTHFMVLSRADEISSLIEKALSEK